MFFFSYGRSRGGVPPLHAAVPRGAAPRGAPPSRAPTSRGRGVQRARGAPPPAGYRPAPPIVQETYGEYVSGIHQALGAVWSPAMSKSQLAQRQYRPSVNNSNESAPLTIETLSVRFRSLCGPNSSFWSEIFNFFNNRRHVLKISSWKLGQLLYFWKFLLRQASWE